VFSLCLLVFVALVAGEPLNTAPAGVAGAGVEGLSQFSGETYGPANSTAVGCVAPKVFGAHPCKG
jgi:hypothetical protein